MKTTGNSVPSCRTAEQAIGEEEAIQRGMDEKSKEFVQNGAEVYVKSETRQ